MVKDYRIFPSQEQKEKINSALGTYRYIYNRYIDFIKAGPGISREGNGNQFYLSLMRSSIEEMMNPNYRTESSRFRWLWDRWNDEFVMTACDWAYHTIKVIPGDKLTDSKFAYITKKDTGNCGKICIPLAYGLLDIIIGIMDRDLDLPDSPLTQTVFIPLLGPTKYSCSGQDIITDSKFEVSPLEIEKRIGREYADEYYMRLYFPTREDTSK